MSKKIAVGGILMVLAAGCASMEPDAQRVPPQEREYTTGSNMPRRTQQQGPSDVKTVDRETMERSSDRGPMPSLDGRSGRW